MIDEKSNCFSFIFFRFLQTVDSAKGRGFAKIVLREFCKRFVAKESMDLIAFVREPNMISKHIFHGLGFEFFSKCSWFKIKAF